MHDSSDSSRRSARRRFVGRLAALFALSLGARHGRAAEGSLAELDAVTRGAPVRPGRVKLEVPQLAENGNSISLRVTADSPMTPEDHVRAIYLFAPKNPRPAVAHFHLGPRAGRAEIATRIRLSGTQRVMAVAEMSDGSFWSDTAEVVVTVAACYDGS
jgi:sulfur-oxidizing protein SoxY